MANLPYVTATGNVTKALNNIAAAATPDAVTQNFVKTILKISGGSGNQMASFLKKVGFVNPDGTPTEIYRKFRNSATRGAAAAESIKFGYAPLYKRNEYLHELSDKEIKGLILEETGAAADSSSPNLILSCIKALKQFADFSASSDQDGQIELQPLTVPKFEAEGHRSGKGSNEAPRGGVGLNVGYNINLNLPATSDIAVFNAIFKSLKENLLVNDDGQS
ncbi:DUF5343 domain-containing protein [Altererythrobacter sp. Root672]|uniref:DUF5343 domain-containing protein n=1 Tax=Altererythrobacter sp. Root672 TaxID=1736584 RepID=UPI000A8984AE|nr:DUF5343 domain-containing protein [Altererythrobacter sp. Root672]